MIKIKHLEPHAWLKTDQFGHESIITDGTISQKRKEEMERKYLKSEVFHTGLWRREIAKEFYEMENPDSTYNRIRKIITKDYDEEETTMTDRMIAYHVNDRDFHIDSKRGDLHAPSTYWLWGNVVTNKANRDDVKYARLFCPEGKRMNWITHATFKKMARNMKHEYITPWSNEQVERCVKAIPSLSKYQAHRFFRALIQHYAFRLVSSGGSLPSHEQFLVDLID